MNRNDSKVPLPETVEIYDFYEVVSYLEDVRPGLGIWLEMLYEESDKFYNNSIIWQSFKKDEEAEWGEVARVMDREGIIYFRRN